MFEVLTHNFSHHPSMCMCSLQSISVYIEFIYMYLATYRNCHMENTVYSFFLVFSLLIDVTLKYHVHENDQIKSKPV